MASSISFISGASSHILDIIVPYGGLLGNEGSSLLEIV
jgi:hypothetical protein